MANFLLNVLLPIGIVFSLIALGHCAFTRRGVAWCLIIVLLGPLGGLVYLAGLKGFLPFEPPAPQTGSGPTAATGTRRCPRCQNLVGVLYDCEDGRKVLKICQMCKSEMELLQSDFKLPT